MTSNADMVRRDLARVWHPCTQMKDHETLAPVPIARGEGVWLYDYDGHRYLDAVSSWWVNLFGHANPHINGAIRDQLERIEHVMLAGLSHAPAVELAERLTAVTPAGLTRVSFADNGSSAVEMALKMSYHAWRNRGEAGRTKFVALSNSYHGETLGALAVGDVALYKETYEPLLMECLIAPSPDCYERAPGESCAELAERRADTLDELLEAHAGEIAAVILEPLVQCAGHMRMYDPVYLQRARAACDRHGIHLIADEVATGFGRTGPMFACEKANIEPDFLCLSKGLTGGYLPLSVVLTTESVYAAFYDDFETRRAFLHSHSYSGNPLGCRAALATLDLFEDGAVLRANQRLATVMTEATAPFRDHPHVAEVRQHGMIVAMELVKDKASGEPYPWQERRGLRVYRYGLEHEAFLRPLGNVVYFMPPYVITEAQIAWLAEIARAGIDQATRD